MKTEDFAVFETFSLGEMTTRKANPPRGQFDRYRLATPKEPRTYVVAESWGSYNLFWRGREIVLWWIANNSCFGSAASTKSSEECSAASIMVDGASAEHLILMISRARLSEGDDVNNEQRLSSL